VSAGRHASSFRDPSGFLFQRDGVLLRQVNPSYREHYDRLIESGLYAKLTKRGWLVPHQEVDEPAAADAAYRVLKPVRLPFVSYPYEWSFSQYQDAARLTLRIQALAMEHGMTLKDASAYNIQFQGSRPLLIDTLSFEIYEPGRPWVAYRQFCQHFLAPLALMSYRDIRLAQLMRSQIDGIPLDLAAALLPRRSRLRFGLLSHLFLHARSQTRMAHSKRDAASFKVSELALKGLVTSLGNAVAKLTWKLPASEWGNYYDDTNYSASSADHKAELVGAMLDAIEPGSVWDLGANDGRYSRIASSRGIPTVAFDIDPVAVEKNYLQARSTKDEKLLALRIDLANPSPALGWDHEERASLADRGPADAVLALALIHHLAIGNNVPLERIAAFLARLGAQLVIEWVPKEDSQVERLLASRQDIFPGYSEDGFVAAFSNRFVVEQREPVGDSHRVLYRLRSRGPERDA
jgi:ribosomal protein L11 methylase PrmA